MAPFPIPLIAVYGFHLARINTPCKQIVVAAFVLTEGLQLGSSPC